MLDVPYLFLNRSKHILLLLSNATSNCKQEERDRRGSLTSQGPPFPSTPPQPPSGAPDMPTLKSQPSNAFFLSFLQTLLFFAFAGLSFNWPNAGKEGTLGHHLLPPAFSYLENDTMKG